MFNELFSGSPKFTYNADTNKYINIRDFLQDHDKNLTYQVKGLFTTKGKYGKRGVIVIDGFNINTPAYLVERIDQIRSNPEMVKAINDGLCGLKFRDYEKDDKIFTTVDLVDYAPITM